MEGMNNMAKIFAANWKLNKSPNQARSFMKELIEEARGGLPPSQIVIFPSAFAMETVLECRKSFGNQLFVAVGAQNTYSQDKGAFTGENSAAVVKEMGGEYVLLGHSERRTLFGETDAALAAKVALVQSLGLIPLLCIGESLEEREKGITEQILSRQLIKGLEQAKPELPLVIAYEPVWAIGTGKVATEVQVQETHAFIAREIERLGFGRRQILYGGSVKAENAGALGQIDHVDGFLVGGASLEVKSFLGIIKACT